MATITAAEKIFSKASYSNSDIEKEITFHFDSGDNEVTMQVGYQTIGKLDADDFFAKMDKLTKVWQLSKL